MGGDDIPCEAVTILLSLEMPSQAERGECVNGILWDLVLRCWALGV